MYEFEVILMERTYGFVRVLADGLEEAKELALHSDAVEWEDARSSDVVAARRIGWDS